MLDEVHEELVVLSECRVHSVSPLPKLLHSVLFRIVSEDIVRVEELGILQVVAADVEWLEVFWICPDAIPNISVDPMECGARSTYYILLPRSMAGR